ncbi:molecular chaperone HtpG [Blattabacterium cuenoti]|uniref:molecular chaperone HtpG n=1 Tax=Blattabacterium cuenoti TaxID=1653831 RepID=UPI00293BCD49|nr:molecular chaperone HtpG [Blattabacterium cuenoti]
MKKKISVTSKNIFPIIKRFLYSDKEIFLRELIANATDAILKLETLSKLGKIDINLGYLKIDISINTEDNTIHILDNGIGMTEEEIAKYINQIAFSGAEEFIKTYKYNSNKAIIGHFGLGFYSAFMVSKKVMIITQSYQDKYPTVCWTCEGSPEIDIKILQKKKIRGTEIILFINDDSKEFLDNYRIIELFNKYCKFMPVPIYFHKNENKKDKQIMVNNIHPIWNKTPSNLKNQDYLDFYCELYQHQSFTDVLFWVHLNIDHPFHLTGVLYFPKSISTMEIQRDQIHLYKNQVYITKNLKGIVPDFLSFLKGVIDSPDIPLNVSRSHLQYDKSVKNISKYITRKVADKLFFLFKKDRTSFQHNWKYIKIIIEYGIITEQNFFEKANKFFLYPTVNEDFFLLEEYKNKVKHKQTNKDGKIIFLYTTDKDKQDSQIKLATERSYEVLIFDSPLTIHLIQKIELEYRDILFIRVDSDHIDKLIHKTNTIQYTSQLSEKEQETIKTLVNSISLIKEYHLSIKLEHLSQKDYPFLIIIPEYSRRIKEMNYQKQNDKDKLHQLIINTNHPIIYKILKESNNNHKIHILTESLMLTLLSKNLLRGKNLTSFILQKFKDIVSQQ